MGIYVFSAKKLYKYLEEDAKDATSSNDFGKDILPKMLAAGEKMMAYEFNGYWKDVGTIDSLYEANMDLLGDDPKFHVADSSWKIQSRSPLAPPHYIGNEAKIGNSIIMSGCEIYGTVENSVLSSDVIVEKGAIVKNSIIMAESKICANAEVKFSIVDEKTTIGKNATVGEEVVNGKNKIAVLGRNLSVEAGASVPAGAIVDNNVTKEEK